MRNKPRQRLSRLLLLFSIAGAALFTMSVPSARAAEGAGPLDFNNPRENVGAEFIEARLHVTDIDRSMKFYTEVMGLKESMRYGFKDKGGFGEIMLSRTGRDQEPRLVISTDPKIKGPIQPGTGFYMLTFAVSDLAGIMKRAEAAGAKVVQPHSKRITPSGANAKLTDWLYNGDILDPDGYLIHMIEFHGHGGK